MGHIEVEFRSLVSKEKLKELEIFLKGSAENLGQDNKKTYFFILPDRFLKVVNNTSQKSAKIVLKLNKMGRGCNFEEVEIPISQKDVTKSIKLFESLGIGPAHFFDQRRHNYLYNGIEIALKKSELWGYHVELEIVIADQKDKAKAENKIRKLAKELGIKLMTEREIAKFVGQLEENYKEGKYGKQETG